MSEGWGALLSYLLPRTGLHRWLPTQWAQLTIIDENGRAREIAVCMIDTAVVNTHDSLIFNTKIQGFQASAIEIHVTSDSHSYNETMSLLESIEPHEVKTRMIIIAFQLVLMRTFVDFASRRQQANSSGFNDHSRRCSRSLEIPNPFYISTGISICK